MWMALASESLCESHRKLLGQVFNISKLFKGIIGFHDSNVHYEVFREGDGVHPPNRTLESNFSYSCLRQSTWKGTKP